FIEVIETLILALVLFIVINTVTARIRVDGSSMEPSFHHNDYVIVNKLSYRLGDFERGDVIIFPNPYNPDEDFIKRVVGLPGDVIQVVDGRLYVNGMMMDEPYLGEPMNKDMSEKVVPEGTLFVMGDNRNDSSDSRAWGPLEIENVLGKAVFVYWPFDGIGLVDDHTVEAANQ
ncbi:MAG: signal peptidase I, partial [Anaerolineae bacterium]|nr:signal peptidase I [Anaerolineae bacterium]